MGGEVEPPTELELQVVCQLLGNLSSFVLLLLGYLTFLLWREYISTILCAFIVSQALHKLRLGLVSAVRALRAPKPSQPLLQSAGVALLRLARSYPPFPTLALILLVLLLADYTSWAWVAAGLASAAALTALPLWLLDRRILVYSRMLSDESLVTVALIGCVAVLAFVAAGLAFRSLVDVAELLRDMFAWTRARVAPQDHALAESMGQIASLVKGFVVFVVDMLASYDTRWGGAKQVLQQLENEANKTEVMGAILEVLRDFFPQNPLLKSDDLLRWADDLTVGQGAMGSELDIRGSVSFAVGWARDAWEKRPENLDSALLDWLRPGQLLSAWKTTGTHGSGVAIFVVWLLVQLFYALYFVLSLGFSTIVFLTMTVYMLSAEPDAVTRVIATFVPRASDAMVQDLQDTVEAALIIPFNAAARNTCISLLLFRVLGVPYAHLGATLSMVLSLFPLIPPCMACVPWVVGLVSTGETFTACILLILMMVLFWMSDMTAERRLLEQVGVSLYVNGFSLVLGVYMFGLQGVLFGPLLVCGVKRIYEYTGAIIQQQAELRPSASCHESEGEAEAEAELELPANTTDSKPGTERTWGENTIPFLEQRTTSLGSQVDRETSDDRRGSIEIISREVLNTMRRLPFFSPPSRSNAVPQRAAAPLAPPSYHQSLTPLFDVCVRRHGDFDQQVRVAIRVEQPWCEFLRSVEERLRNASLLLAADRVVGMRCGAIIVASTSDLRHGEVLDAIIESSSSVESPDDKGTETGKSVLDTPNTRHSRLRDPLINGS